MVTLHDGEGDPFHITIRCRGFQSVSKHPKVTVETSVFDALKVDEKWTMAIPSANDGDFFTVQN